MPTLSRIQVRIDPFSGTHAILYCHQCRRAPCARSCPQGAIQQSVDADYWVVDESLCNGCGDCVAACPFEAMILDQSGGRAIKCDTCHGEPECVLSCPKGALLWVLDEQVIPETEGESS